MATTVPANLSAAIQQGPLWLQAWVGLLVRRSLFGISTAFGLYVHFYLLVAGISLVIDLIDVVRYLVDPG